MEYQVLLGTLRWKALESFKDNLQFLLELQESKNDKVSYLISISNEDQIKCLFYLLYFISKKEIPLQRDTLSVISHANKELLKKFNKNQEYFINLLESSREERILTLLSFAKAFSTLVFPILNKF